MIEESGSPKCEKFHKVQQKLNLLAQSKLQNLSQNGFRHAEERLNIIEKKLIEEITSNQKTTRDYRLRLRSFQEQFKQIQEKCRTSMEERSAKIRELQSQFSKFMVDQSQQRSQKEKWCEEYCTGRIEKIEKELVVVRQDRKYDVGQLNQRLVKMMPEDKEVIELSTRALNSLLVKKMEGVSQECNELREGIRREMGKGEKGEKKIMEHLKGVVSEIKGILSEEKAERQKNRDRLIVMLQQATKNIMIR